jgi:tRNA isopentenyl-2-thiomethyl-A-37 hydroxylase MiaE
MEVCPEEVVLRRIHEAAEIEAELISEMPIEARMH